MNWIPRHQQARLGIDRGGPGGDTGSLWLRLGGEFLCELRPGDSYMPHPAGGVIVCNPDSKPVWHRVVDGERVREELEPALWPDAAGVRIAVRIPCETNDNERQPQERESASVVTKDNERQL